MRAAGHLSVKFGRVIGALASDINGLRWSVLCDESLRFLASGEKPRLEGKSNLLRMRQEIPLSDAALAALDEGVSALESLLGRLANVQTPAHLRRHRLSDGRQAAARFYPFGIGLRCYTRAAFFDPGLD